MRTVSLPLPWFQVYHPALRNNVVVLITNVVRNNVSDSLINSYQHRSESSTSDLRWICDDSVPLTQTCSVDPADWTFSDPGSSSRAKVNYCLADPTEPQCTIELIPALLYTVIACNIVKGLAFAYLAILQFDPLITIGQAVASFLENPDPTTEGLGAHSARDIRGRWISDPQGGTYWCELNQNHIYKPERRKWFSGASPMRWVLTLLA